MAAAIVLAACGSDSGSDTASTATTGEASGDTGESVNIAFVGWGTANGYAQATMNGIKKEAEALGATADMQDGGLDPTKQLAVVQDDATSGRYDVMIIQPLDGAGIVPAAEQAIKAGIKVVAVYLPLGSDIGSPTPQVDGMTAVVGAPVAQSGKVMGELAIEACADKNPCEVAYLAGLGSLPHEAIRTDAVEEALKKASNVKLVSVQEAPPTTADGLKVAQNILTANPDLDVLIGNNDQTALGGSQAVEQANKEVAVIGDGGSIEGVTAIRDGSWFGTFLNLPETEGEIAAELGVKAARGETVPDAVNPADRIDQPVGANAENLGNFKGQWHTE
jgi:ribose transport system substrate-binding protein